MNGLYANCPVHGLFPIGKAYGGVSSGVTFVNAKTNCPKCNRTSIVIDGTYNFDEKGIAEFVTGPEFSRAIYEQFKGIVNAASVESLSQEEVVRRTEAISPGLAGFISQFNVSQTGSLTDWLSILLSIIAMFLSNNQPANITNVTNNITNNFYDDSGRPGAKRKLAGFYPPEKKETARLVTTPKDCTPNRGKQKKAKKPMGNVNSSAGQLPDSTKQPNRSTKAIIIDIVKKKGQ